MGSIPLHAIDVSILFIELRSKWESLDSQF